MWQEVNEIGSVPTPAVLVSGEQVAANIEACISLASGIHACDAHIHDRDTDVRRANVRTSREIALGMRERPSSEGVPFPEIVVGGTPTFPSHAAVREEDVSLSPGTYVYHDWGYNTRYPDLPFEMAAMVLGRVISVPRAGRFTVDIGSKAIAADPE